MQEALEFKNFALVKTAVKFRNLQISKKKLTALQAEIFIFLYRLYAYL